MAHHTTAYTHQHPIYLSDLVGKKNYFFFFFFTQALSVRQTRGTYRAACLIFSSTSALQSALHFILIKLQTGALLQTPICMQYDARGFFLPACALALTNWQRVFFSAAVSYVHICIDIECRAKLQVHGVLSSLKMCEIWNA